MLYPMETFVLFILAILAVLLLFLLLAFPAVLLLGAACSILKGVRAGMKPAPTHH